MSDKNSHFRDLDDFLTDLLNRLEWNQRAFAGEIDEPDFTISRARHGHVGEKVRGRIVYKVRSNLGGKLTEEERNWLNLYQAWCDDRTDRMTTESWKDRWRRIHADEATARELYLRAIATRLNSTGTHAFIDSTRWSPKGFPLLGEAGIYVPLSFDPPIPMSSSWGEENQSAGMNRQAGLPDLFDVLRLPEHLVIEGDAGSGKTTILYIVGTLLAKPEFARSYPFIDTRSPMPLPVYLPLRDFELACSQDQGRSPRYDRTPADLLRYLDEWCRHWLSVDQQLPPDFLADHVRRGEAWLLLDALNEVANPTHRDTIANCIRWLADSEGCRNGTRLIVTARTRAYPSSHLGNRFQVVRVRDLSAEQQADLIHRLYAGLALSNHRRRAESLIQRTQSPDFPKELLRTPVRVWTVATIDDESGGGLPRSLADLYHRYVKIMLAKGYDRVAGNVEGIEGWAQSGDWSEQDRWQILTYGAFSAHKRNETQERDPETQERSRRLSLGFRELTALLANYMVAQKFVSTERQGQDRAKQFVTLMLEQSGLLVEEQGVYRFGDHLTMQEYLAGCYVGEQLRLDDPQGFANFIASSYRNSWWRGVFRFAVEHLLLNEKSAQEAPEFLRHLAGLGSNRDDRLAALAFAGAILHEMASMAYALEQSDTQWYDQLCNKVTGELRVSLECSPLEAELVTRQEAGLALGLLYGWPDPVSGTGRDPRFPYPHSLPDFVTIRAGRFQQGADREPTEGEYPIREISFRSYQIALYPTTNAMYSLFVLDHGYQNPTYWPEAIEDGCWREGKIDDGIEERNCPAFWHDTRFNNPAQPVVGVNWYEARAYCLWLSEKCGREYRLANESEWERAAQAALTGDDGCNSRELALGQPSAVGVFLSDRTLRCPRDMSGNVWEWCQDGYEADYYARSPDRNPPGQEKDLTRVLLGGSFNSVRERCTPYYRFRDSPEVAMPNYGFRIVRSIR